MDIYASFWYESILKRITYFFILDIAYVNFFSELKRIDNISLKRILSCDCIKVGFYKKIEKI